MARPFQCLLAVGGFADDFEVALGVEDHAQPFAHQTWSSAIRIRITL